MSTANDVTLIRLPELRQKLGGVGKTTVYELMKSSGFPAPVKLGTTISAWVVSDVDGWIAQRAAQRAGTEVAA